MKIISDHGFPKDVFGTFDEGFAAFKNERDYVKQIGRPMTTVAAMDWAATEIARLRAWAEDEQRKREAVEEDRLRERQENERLRDFVRGMQSVHHNLGIALKNLDRAVLEQSPREGE